MKKHLANIISCSRIIGSVILFTCSEISTKFLVVYIICGFTDLIDGPIARKTGSSSTIGATLDTIGDVATYLALTRLLVKNKLVPNWILIWIISVGVLFGVCAFVSKHRFDKFYLPHTNLGKVFGGSVFVLPIAMQFMPREIWMAVICSIATVHMAELFIIQTKISEAKDFVPSALHIKKLH